jgi:hypothetical protein
MPLFPAIFWPCAPPNFLAPMSVFFVSSSESSHDLRDARTESLVEVVLASGPGVVALVVHFLELVERL